MNGIPFLHLLSDKQLEELSIELLSEQLGAGIQGFATGKDGGRDARFNGKANCFPSSTSPWNGKVIIQVKHTELLNKSFSESDFSGEKKSSILSEEIPKLKTLIADGELDFYVLIANRRLNAISEQAIRKRIAKETGLSEDNIRLIGVSELERMSKRYPDAVARAQLNPVESTFFVNPEDLAEIIAKLAKYQDDISDTMDGTKSPPEDRESPVDKNERNGLSKKYFQRQMRSKMAQFPRIREFLAAPENHGYQQLYEEASEEIRAKIDTWQDDSFSYERILETILSQFFKFDFDLRKNKSATRAVVYFMYCNCDIGSEVDATS